MTSETLLSIFSRDNITLALAILGSIGTMISAIGAVVRNRKHIEVTLLGYNFTPELYTCYILIENKSRLPISINKIVLVHESNTYLCTLIPKMAIEITRTLGNETIRKREYDSESFPINIPGMTSHSGFVLFESAEPLPTIDSTSVTFQVHTNRGRAAQIELSLDSAFDPFEILLL